MLTKRRIVAALLAAATLLTTGIGWSARDNAEATETGVAADAPPVTDRTVTLLTGDRITVSGADARRLSVERAPGREKASFLTRFEGGAMHVVPTDAAALLGSGRLDARLFDVTRLLRSNDDAPLLVEGSARRVGPEGRAALWRDLVDGRVAKVLLDAPRSATSEVDETYELTIRYIGRAGQPSSLNTTFINGLDVSAGEQLYDVAGTVTVRLPRGTYQIGSFLPNSADDRFAGAMLVQPELLLTGPQTVVVDARLARPVKVSVSERGAVPVMATIGYSSVKADGGSAGGDLIAENLDRQYTAQIGGGARVDRFASVVAVTLRQRVGGDSAYAYHLAYFERGRMWTGLGRRPTRRDLATVRVHQAQTMTGSSGYGLVDHILPGVPWGMLWAHPSSAGPLPRVATEYYNTDAGVRWDLTKTELSPGGEESGTGQTHFELPVAYQPGRDYREEWNKAVFGPGFPATRAPQLWITRTGDRMVVWPSWFTDGANHNGQGDARAIGYKITLYRDGKQVAASSNDAGFFTVPTRAGRYQLEARAKRSQPFELSTQLNTAWTFDSEHVAGNTPQALPLSAVRFMPGLDDRNAAPGGRVYAVPVTVTSQQGSTAGTLKDLTIEVSYDDGATWQPTELRRTTTGGTALLRHPAGPGFVSVRATATDSAGNTVNQTVIRAYRLRAA